METIIQLELSGYCNLKCSYCPYSTSRKEKGFMTNRTLNKVLKVLKEMETKRVSLSLFGEPLLHPNIFEFIKKISSVAETPYFYSNGLLLTREVAIKLKKSGLKELYISLHKPEIKQNVIKAVRGLGLLKGLVTGVDIYAHNFAGAIKGKRNSVKKGICPFIFSQWGVIYHDGSLASCCIDSTNRGILGNIFEDRPKDLIIKPFETCKRCHFKSYDFTLADKINRYRTIYSKILIKKLKTWEYD